MTPKQIYALAQGNWRRHVNAKHDGHPFDDCKVCRDHSRVMRQALADAFAPRD